MPTPYCRRAYGGDLRSIVSHFPDVQPSKGQWFILLYNRFSQLACHRFNRTKGTGTSVCTGAVALVIHLFCEDHKGRSVGVVTLVQQHISESRLAELDCRPRNDPLDLDFVDQSVRLQYHSKQRALSTYIPCSKRNARHAESTETGEQLFLFSMLLTMSFPLHIPHPPQTRWPPCKCRWTGVLEPDWLRRRGDSL